MYNATKEVKGWAMKRGHSSKFSVYNGTGCEFGCQGSVDAWKKKKKKTVREPV